MKRLLIAMLASTTITLGIPALAQAHPEPAPLVQHDDDQDNSWNNGGASYVDFDREYQHIWQTIQHGISDGAYSRRQGSRFYREMQDIRRHAEYDERRGAYNPEQTQARLERLHEWMHEAHERGHERQDGDYGYRR